MEINPVDKSSQLAAYVATTQKNQQQQVQENNDKRPGGTKAQDDKISVGLNESTRANLGLMDKVKAMTSEVNAYAKVIRETDTVLQKASNQVVAMKSELDKIVKNFPPYPPGSEERVALLKSFSSLRKEIDKLTFPPPEDLNTPALKQLFADMFDADGKFNAKKSLNIPETLPEDATDKQISSTIDTLAVAKDQLDSGRNELGKVVNNLAVGE